LSTLPGFSLYFVSRCLLLACFSLAVSDGLAQVPAHKKVVVISLDGFPAYAFDDPRLPTPTLRRLIHEGTYAAMHPVNPTVTWPNHTAMVTGVTGATHHVLFNGLLERPATGGHPVVEPWRDKDVMVYAPTVYDLAHQAGLTIAQVDWVAIYNAKTITWKFPERPDPDGEIEKDLIADGTATREQIADFDESSAAWRDQIWTDATIDILKKHHPDLMLFHLLNLDGMNHHYGPMTDASFTTMAYVDSKVQQMLDALRESGDLERTAVLVVSDHGFRSFHHAIHANALLKERGWITNQDGKSSVAAWIVPEGGSAMVYISDPGRKKALMPQIHQAFAGVEGVDHVYDQEDYAKLGFPTAEASDQSPDLFLTAKEDYAFMGGEEGAVVTPVEQRGAHGYINSDPKMQPIFIAWGAGIRSGVKLETISNIDVAPTIASLLGLKMTHIEGHPLTSILK